MVLRHHQKHPSLAHVTTCYHRPQLCLGLLHHLLLALGRQQGTAYLPSVKTRLFKAQASFETDSTSQQQLTAKRPSSNVRLMHTPPTYQALGPPSHVSYSPSNDAAVHSINASTGSAAIRQPAVAYQVKNSHKLSGMGNFP